MHVQVTVELDGDDLVVVKSATSGDAVERLRAEAARLERAAHPGVVALVSARPGRSPDDPAGCEAGTGFELRLAHAGEPITAWAPTPTDLAGLAASLATTLADLHDAGIVHGRVEAAHVLVGADGHPRLCGLAGAPGATPEDDVAGWGRLVAELVARSRASRRGARRLRARGRDRHCRALAEVAERAIDPVAERRPTARAIADAVVSAVPEASLPGQPLPGWRRGGGGAAAARVRPPRTRGDSGAAEVDTLDRIWSWEGEPSEDERWAAVFGVGPSRAGDQTVDLPLAHRPALGWDDPGAGGPAAYSHDAGRDRGTRGADRNHPGEALPPAGDEAHAADRNPDSELHHGDGNRHDGRNRNGEARTPVSSEGGAVDGGADLPTRDLRPVGRARHRSEVPAPVASTARRGRVVAVATGVATVLVAGAWVAAAARERGPGGGAGASRTPSPPAGCPPVAGPAADVDGDGCREALALDGGTLDAGVAAWTIGEAGDLVTLGDWDCDGEASPAVLRPATGDVFVFSTWAALDEPVTVAATDRVPGGRAIRAEPGGAACDRLVVEGTDGTPEQVEVGGGG